MAGRDEYDQRDGLMKSPSQRRGITDHKYIQHVIAIEYSQRRQTNQIDPHLASPRLDSRRGGQAGVSGFNRFRCVAHCGAPWLREIVRLPGLYAL